MPVTLGLRAGCIGVFRGYTCQFCVCMRGVPSLSEKDVLEGDGDSVCGVNGLAGGGEPAFSNGLVYECTC